MERIKLNSRDGDGYLEKVDNNTYKLITKYYYRTGSEGSSSTYLWVDPSGGPMIQVGKKVNEVGRLVKSIESKGKDGLLITFE